MEIWKDIDGFDKYEISNLGNIRNKKNKKMRAFSEHRDGYLKVILFNCGKRHYFQVHRLVAITFIRNDENLPVVNHKNGNKSDNRVENLEWCTVADNTKHAYDSGLAKGHNGGMNKLVAVYCDNGELLKVFNSITDVSEYFKTSRNAIREAIKRDSKTGKSIKGYKVDFYNEGVTTIESVDTK